MGEYIHSMGYDGFTKAIYGQIGTQKVPIRGTIELTARCNLKCAHCYINVPANDEKAIREELSSTEIYGIIDQITEAGCLWLLITGGEPLLRQDFLDIYTYVKKKGLIPTLFTNGTLMTPSMADTLKKWPPLAVEITVHGATQKTYERVTGVPGSFSSCMKGIRLLLDQKIPLRLKTTVMSLNKHELPEIKSLAEKLGVEYRFDTLIIPRIDEAAKKPCDLRITPKEVVQLDLTDRTRYSEWIDYFKESHSIPKQRRERLYLCTEIMDHSFHIDSVGRMFLCHTSRSPSHDLRKSSFKIGWNEFFPKIRSLKTTRATKCTSCEMKPFCECCPGLSLLEHGDPETPVEYSCQITHLRAKTFSG